MLLVTLLTQSAAFGWHARSLPVRHRVSPPVACANEGLIGTMCAFETDDERQAAMKAVFGEWPAGSHDSKGDDVVAAISKRIGETQAAALAAHGRGEDTAGWPVESAVLAAPQLATASGGWHWHWLALHSLEEQLYRSEPNERPKRELWPRKSRGS